MARLEIERMRKAIEQFVSTMVLNPNKQGEIDPIVIDALIAGILDPNVEIDARIIRDWYDLLVSPILSDEEHL